MKYLKGNFTNYLSINHDQINNCKVIVSDFYSLDNGQYQVYCKVLNSEGEEILAVPLIVAVGDSVSKIDELSLNMFKKNMIADDLELISE